jgi:hypothetical protein
MSDGLSYFGHQLKYMEYESDLSKEFHRDRKIEGYLKKVSEDKALQELYTQLTKRLLQISQQYILTKEGKFELFGSDDMIVLGIKMQIEFRISQLKKYYDL